MSEKRPESITAIASLLLLSAGVGLILAVIVTFLPNKTADPSPFLWKVAALAILNTSCGLSFLAGKNWGRLVFFLFEPVVYLSIVWRGLPSIGEQFFF